MEEHPPIHLTPGLTLPVVTLPATDGSDICLATLEGQTIVAVYPWTGKPGLPKPPGWDDIPGAHGSTPELEGFRDLFEPISQSGSKLFALSGQSTSFQREMALRLGLPFPVLSDKKGAMARALRLPAFEAGGIKYLKRISFTISDGRIEYVFHPIEDPESHPARVVDWLKSRS